MLDRTFSALSDPTRRHILERADLVITQKQGRTRQCRLGSEHLDDAAQWIQTYQRRWEGRLGRLGGYLERKKGARR